jgi:chemotaxis protein CheD
METIVRMGELQASRTAGHVLVALGLGSCIGLALTDRRMGVAGLAHIVLPESQGHAVENRRKFADLAIPELVTELVDLGAMQARLEAVLVGGATMFAPGLQVGQRNEIAVRALLGALGIPVVASATGGSLGRTMRVDVATGDVTVREAGSRELEVMA